MGVWVSIALVVDGKVSNHAFGNKLLLTKFFYHGEILFFRHLYRERQHDAPGKLGVPLVLHGFHGVPEGCPVCKSGRRMGRQHQAVSGSNIPVEISEKGFDSSLFHLVCRRAEVNRWYLLDALPLKGAQVNTLRSACCLQIAVGDGFPAVPPDLGVLLVVPVHGVFLVALPVARGKLDALTVFIKVINLSGFRKPLAVFVHCPERQ